MPPAEQKSATGLCSAQCPPPWGINPRGTSVAKGLHSICSHKKGANITNASRLLQDIARQNGEATPLWGVCEPAATLTSRDVPASASPLEQPPVSGKSAFYTASRCTLNNPDFMPRLRAHAGHKADGFFISKYRTIEWSELEGTSEIT